MPNTDVLELIRDTYKDVVREFDSFRKDVQMHIAQDAAAFGKVLQALESITKTLDQRGVRIDKLNERITTLETKLAMAMGGGIVIVFLIEAVLRRI